MTIGIRQQAQRTALRQERHVEESRCAKVKDDSSLELVCCHTESKQRLKM